MKRISLVSGICLLPDAISYSMVRKIEVIRESFGSAASVRAFSYACNVDDPACTVVDSPRDLLANSHFAASDLVVYEFGIYYDLFNTIFAVPGGARKVAVFHNITPEHLVQWEDQRAGIRRGMLQRANLLCADHILCDSEFNRRDLIEFGIPEERLSVLNLPLPHGFSVTPRQPKPFHGTVELLYVGRFVHPKGVLDLVEAVALAIRQGCRNLRLTLVGDLTFSDGPYIEKIREAISASGLEAHYRFTGQVSQSELIDNYDAAHIFAIPSYHEGYCLPVVEAMSRGCIVVATDAGNLPFIINGLGRVVPVGDTLAMARALTEVANTLSRADGVCLPLDCGDLTIDQYHHRVEEYAGVFTYEHFAHKWSEFIREEAFGNTRMRGAV